MTGKIWRFVCSAVGGFHEVGSFAVLIHDGGIMLCVRRVIRFEWPRSG